MDNTDNIVYLLLGGNLSNVKETFISARQKIGLTLGEITKNSKLYQSKAWGFESSHFFLNQVIKVTTNKSAKEVLKITQSLELELGRVKTKGQIGYESRVIDIDILYFNKDLIENESLTIPHNAISERKFTLAPLAEIAPDFVHPILLKTNMELFQSCPDKSNVNSI